MSSTFAAEPTVTQFSQREKTAKQRDKPRDAVGWQKRSPLPKLAQ
jgi:hypothetical protein